MKVVRKLLDDIRGFVFPQQTVVDQNARQLRTNRLIHQGRDDRGKGQLAHMTSEQTLRPALQLLTRDFGATLRTAPGIDRITTLGAEAQRLCRFLLRAAPDAQSIPQEGPQPEKDGEDRSGGRRAASALRPSLS